MESKLSRKEIKPVQSTHNSTTPRNESRDTPIFKAYHVLSPGIQILQGPHAQGNKIFGHFSRDKQSPATCIVASVYDKVFSTSYWDKKDVEKILEIGDKLYRTSVSHTPLKKWQILKPHCVFPTFYIGQFKVTIFVGNDVITGENTPQNSQLSKLLIDNIPQLLDEHYSVVLHFHEKNFSIWKNGGAYYFFCPHDANHAGYLARTNQGKSFVMFAESIEKLSNHLTSFIYGKFSMYSVKILKFLELSRTMSGLIAQMEQDDEIDVPEIGEGSKSKSGQIKDKVKSLPGHSKDLADTSKLFDLSTTGNYFTVVQGQGSLVHNTHEQNFNSIMGDLFAAIITLHNIKSSLWATSTIGDILKLGSELLKDIDFNIETDIACAYEVKAYDRAYKIVRKKIIYGDLTSKDEDVVSIAKGLKLFFDSHDVGIIYGAQNVAIWKEKGVYFVFDPKERDALGRKWTRQLSKELGPPKKGGGACVCWFSDIDKLAERYMSNVAQKYRNNSFCILSITLQDLSDVFEEWAKWDFVKAGRWMLQGDDSICKYLMSDEENKKGKLLSVGCYAIAFKQKHPTEEWTGESLNTLLKDGMEFYKNSVRLADQEATLTSSKEALPDAITELSDIKKLITVEGEQVQLIIDDCVVSGKCPSKLSAEPPTFGLRGGIESFFESYRSGLIILEKSVLPIWTDSTGYYFLDSCEKSNAGQALVKNFKNFGNITAARFTKLSDMIDVITSNSKYLGCGEFCISRVESSGDSGAGIPLRHYKMLAEQSAILAKDDFHEGHSIFGPRADNQTRCNVLNALCLPLLHKSAEWQTVDIVDIIRGGDKMYSNILENFEECEANNRKIAWEDLHPKIGLHKFQFTREEQEGILAKPVGEPVAIVEESLVSGSSNIETGRSSDRSKSVGGVRTDSALKSQSNSKNDNSDVNLEEMSARTVEEEQEEVIEPDTLAIILSKLDAAPFYTAILETDFFTVALWKQDGLYFIFDPKANNYEGYPSERRIKQGLHEVRARIDAENERKLREAVINNDEEDAAEAGPSLAEAKSKSKGAANQSAELSAEPSKDANDSKVSQQSRPSQFDHTEVAMKEDPVDLKSLPNDGSAYVAWFQTQNGLVQHVVSKLPREYQDDPITFHVLHITKSPIDPKGATFKNFDERDAEGFWLLRASISQDDALFPNRKLQDITNSIIALSFTTISPPDEWTTTILNILLKYGDRLYTKSLLALKSDNKQKLELDLIARSFSIYKIKFDFNVEPAQSHKGILNNPTQFEEINPSFVESMNKLPGSKTPIGAILKLNDNYNVAIWKTGQNIFIFDPHENDPNGRCIQIGVACLMRFSNFNTLFKILREKFNNSKEAIKYELIFIAINTSKPDTAAVPTNTVENFIVPGEQSAFIKDDAADLQLLTTNPREEELSEVLTCLASVVLSHLLHTECWTPTILNKVFSLAQNLTKNSHSVKIKVTSDKAELDLKGLIRCFTVDGTICTLDIDEVIRGPITSTNPEDVTLLNSLNLFLRNYCRAIVITSSYTCAIWREQEKFYLFNAEKGKDSFVLGSQHQDNLYDWMVENGPKEGDSNWYEIVRVEIASILARDVEKPPANKGYRKRVRLNVLTDCKPKHKKRTCGPETCKFTEGTFGSLNAMQLADLSKVGYFRISTDINPCLQIQREKAACIVAAGMCHLKDIAKWKKDTFDTISRSALMLYMDSVAVKGSLQIDITNMEKHFQLQDIQLQVEPLPPSNERPTPENIREILEHTFQKHKIAYITTSSESMLAIRWNTKCYAFHPEKMSPQGNYVKACVVNLQSFEELVRHLVQRLTDNHELVTFGAVKVFALK